MPGPRKLYPYMTRCFIHKNPSPFMSSAETLTSAPCSHSKPSRKSLSKENSLTMGKPQADKSPKRGSQHSTYSLQNQVHQNKVGKHYRGPRTKVPHESLHVHGKVSYGIEGRKPLTSLLFTFFTCPTFPLPQQQITGVCC